MNTADLRVTIVRGAVLTVIACSVIGLVEATSIGITGIGGAIEPVITVHLACDDALTVRADVD